jgi:hypothetical protein
VAAGDRTELPSAEARDGVQATRGGALPEASDDWVTLSRGLDERWWPDPSGEGRELYALRVDPVDFTLGVQYSQEEPRFVEDWAATTGAEVVLNGGFFDENNRSTALVVSGGRASGQSYRDFGGMLSASQETGVDLTWLAHSPFTSTFPLQAAVQSAPMLVHDGVAVYTQDDSAESRRSVVAMDTDGRLVLFVAPGGGYTLAGLAARLAEDDLLLDRALNLDGGSSMGLAVGDGTGGRYRMLRHFPDLARLPAVITLTRR